MACLVGKEKMDRELGFTLQKEAK
ncbi:uncharacterized protein G2W53_008646 [Senna tora]|uniref:Uncharacterized protein n=1 Tax=Senna tora TaxID=362788 RepID=A0A835CFE5_9FABA|nr:uncharacterized protein G2W53_008646 [Senna tora]